MVDWPIFEIKKLKILFYDIILPTQTLRFEESLIQTCTFLLYRSSAFFRGQAEHPKQRPCSGDDDDPVYIAVNTSGVSIIDADDFVCI